MFLLFSGAIPRTPTSFADRHLLGIGIKEAKELHLISLAFHIYIQNIDIILDLYALKI